MTNTAMKQIECIAIFECYKQNWTIAFYLRLLDFKQLPTWKKREKVTLYDSKVKFWKKLEENGGNITNQQGLQYRHENYSTLVIAEGFNSRFCQEQSDKWTGVTNQQAEMINST